MAMPVRVGVNWGEVRPAAEAFLRSPARVPMLSWSRAGGDRVARIQRLADDLGLIDTDYQRSPESIAASPLSGARPGPPRPAGRGRDPHPPGSRGWSRDAGPALPAPPGVRSPHRGAPSGRPVPPAAQRAPPLRRCAGDAVRADPPGARRPRPRREGRRRAAVGIAADESAGDAGARQPPSRLSG